MTQYKVVLDGVPTIAVEITRSDGANSIRSFRTEAAALMWIADQELCAAIAEAQVTDAGTHTEAKAVRMLPYLSGHIGL